MSGLSCPHQHYVRDVDPHRIGDGMANINDIDQRVLGVLSGGDKIRALLKGRGLSLTDFARRHNHWVSDVSRCLAAKQPLPEIRDSLAAELEWERAEVDR